MLESCVPALVLNQEPSAHQPSIQLSELQHNLVQTKTFPTQSLSRPGAATRAGTPELGGASPAGTPSRPSWQTLALHTEAASARTRSSTVERGAATPLTALVTVGQFLGDPLDGFGSDLGAEVPVKR